MKHKREDIPKLFEEMLPALYADMLDTFPDLKEIEMTMIKTIDVTPSEMADLQEADRDIRLGHLIGAEAIRARINMALSADWSRVAQATTAHDMGYKIVLRVVFPHFGVPE